MIVQNPPASPASSTRPPENFSGKLRRLPLPEEYHNIPDGGICAIPEKLLLFVRYGRLPGQTTPLALHRRFVLIFNFGGDGTFFINDRMLDFFPGQAILLFPFQLHSYILHQKQREWLYITFCLSESSHLTPLTGSPVEITPDLRQLAEAIIDDYSRSEDPHRLSKAKCRLSLALIEMLGAREKMLGKEIVRPCGKSGTRIHVEEIVAYVFRHIGRPTSVGDVSEALGIPYDYCRTLFKCYTGTALSAFIEEIRTRRATLLLKHTTRSLKVIAVECGYGSQENFSRSYKRKTGFSPKQIRNP